jgi:hypothetical protein
MTRGAVLVQDGEYVGTKGRGRFLKRDLTQYLT